MAKNRLEFQISAKDKTKQAFSKIKSGLKGITKAVTSFKTALVAAAGAIGIGLLIRNSLKSIDQIGKLSRQLFISTEDLGAFKLAADLGGTSLEAFAKGARTLGVGINDFLVKGTGIAKEAFEQLGITADDLRATNGDLFAQFELVADALNQLEGNVDKTAIAYKLFGGRNIELLTAIEGGTAGIQKIRKEAERFGLTLSADMVKRVEDANDAITRLKFRFTGLVDNITVALAPALQTVVDSLGAIFDTFVESKGGIENFSTVMVDKMLGAIQALIMGLGNVIIGIENFMNNLRDLLGWTGLFDSAMSKLQDKLDAYKQSLEFFEQGGTDGFVHPQVHIDHLKGKIAETEEEMRKLGGAFAITHGEGKTTTEIFTELIEIMENLRAKNKELTAAMGDQHDAHVTAHNAYLENLKKEEEAMEAIGKMEHEKFMRMKRISDETVAMKKRELEAKKKMEEDFKVFSENTTLSLFEKLGTMNKKAFEIYKNLLISRAVMDTYAAALAAFKNFGGWPMGTIAAGLTIAEGMAKVAMIRSQQYTGKRFGGPVKEGQPYMVGESGQELFVPGQSGTIVPNNALGGGQNINVTFNVDTVDASGFDQLLSTRRAMIVNMINTAVNDQGRKAIV